MADAARLIALDWGTSSLRAYLMGDEGKVLATNSKPWGIMHVPGGNFLAAFDEITAGWQTSDGKRLPAVAAGMIGSTQGWINAPYCPCPAGRQELADNLARIEDANLVIIPGINVVNGTPNVMRGEETQIFGVLETHPHLNADTIFVMPGTHSKWVKIADDKVVSFDTYMTGEMFAILKDHSILGRPAKDSVRNASPEEAEAAFFKGVDVAREAENGPTPLLFSARARFLAGEISAEASLDYLSGLLIGEEIRCGLAKGAKNLTLIGNPDLCHRYQIALPRFGAPDALQVSDASQAGLWSIACQAGIVSAQKEHA